MADGNKGKGFSYLFQMFVAWVFLFAVVAAFVLLVLMKVLAPYFLASKQDHSLGDDLADNRCKCVCPHNLDLTIRLNKTVWLKEVGDPSDCMCEEVLPTSDDVLCLQCECSFESRNRVLIASIVGIFVLLVFCLLLYTIFVCLQPLIFKNSLRSRRDQYSLLGEEHQTNSSIYNLSLRMQQMRWRQRVAEDRLTESMH